MSLISKSILCALASVYLTGCATPLPAPASRISPSLTAPCPPYLPRALVTWGDLAQSYAEAMGELSDCRARQKALADAVKR